MEEHDVIAGVHFDIGHRDALGFDFWSGPAGKKKKFLILERHRFMSCLNLISMSHPGYNYKTISKSRYTFISTGRKKIEKTVEFSDFGIKNTYNLAFGDLKTDGSIDDMANSNNGDIIRVLSTVISIIKDFTAKNPHAYIAFAGSTEERMKLYARILKSYYSVFKKEFTISGFIKWEKGYRKVSFDPTLLNEYIVFLIKRIQ